MFSYILQLFDCHSSLSSCMIWHLFTDFSCRNFKLNSILLPCQVCPWTCHQLFSLSISLLIFFNNYPSSYYKPLFLKIWSCHISAPSNAKHFWSLVVEFLYLSSFDWLLYHVSVPAKAIDLYLDLRRQIEEQIQVSLLP